MKGLKCTTTNCEYNHGYHCKAGVINVSKRGTCLTKVKREYGALGQSFANQAYEASEDFDYSKNEDVLIQCDSCKCMYNKEHQCRSSVVTVGNGLVKTKCFTKRVIE